jgi:large subunit ribosomal protein L24
LQTTLLTIAVAVILALVAALVGPFFIDWGNYRSLFEKEASRLVGLDVHIRGPIDARLLPSPRLQLNDIAIGDGGALRARSLAIEFALGSLMRGEWRADDMHVVGPEVHAGVDPAGQVTMPTIALNFDPDALSIDRLSIEDGKAVLSDAASGASLTMDKVWFNGELRSLLGPVKGEGAATVGGAMYPFRLSSGRANDDGALRLRLNVDPVDTPLNIEADGALSLAQGKPQFQGTWSLSRPVGIAPRNAAAVVTQPWRLSGKVKATPASALMEQVDFQYGSDAAAVKLSGTAELAFGARPRFNGVLSARQIDLDKLAGEDEAAHAPPAATIRRLAGLVGNAFRPPFPIQLGVGIDLVTLGGTDLQNLRGDVSTAAGGWTLDRFEFRAPGLSNIKLSGRLGFVPDGVVFTGPAEVAANDPNELAAWLEGRKDGRHGAPRPLRLRGDVTLGPEKIAIERLNASFDRGAVGGRFVYAFGAGRTGARIDASLSAPELDLDAASAFAKALAAGSNLERPSEVALALDIGRVSYAGIDAGKTEAKLQYDRDGLRIEQLTVDNFGGANVAARGQIALAPTPHGSLALDVDARDLTGVNALLARYAPDLAGRLRVLAPALAPAKLHADLGLDESANGKRAALNINGTAGVAKVAFKGDGAVDPSAHSLGSLRVQGQADATDLVPLARALGADRIVAVAKAPGTLRLTLSGDPSGDMALNTWVSSPALAASATGTIRLGSGDWPAGALSLNVARADLAPLRGASLPVAVTARVTSDGKAITADEISAVVAGSKVRGKLTASLAMPSRVEGVLDLDTVDPAALLAAAVAVPTTGKDWTWSSAPFGEGMMHNVAGEVSLNALSAKLPLNLTARQFRATLRLGDGAVALDKVSASVAGGDLGGGIAFKPGADGLAVRAQVSLGNGDVAAMLPVAARPPVSGRLNAQMDLEGSGRSPVALVGSLHGSGRIALSGGQFAGLDPRAFAAVTRAVDQGLPAEAAKIEPLAGKALDSGPLRVRQAEGELAIGAGQVRLTDAKASGEGADKGADLSLAGALDLTNGTLDARLVLTGADAAAGARPDIFVALHGPVDAPAKTLDVSGLTGWLTLRAIDLQSKKIEAIEAAPKVEPKAEPKAEPKIEPKSELMPPQAEPAVTPPPAVPPPKPKEVVAPKRPAAHPPAPAAPSLPPPINILPAPAVQGAR